MPAMMFHDCDSTHRQNIGTSDLEAFMEDLAGHTVLITGANRGLGAAFVEAALARHADTVYAAARNPRSLPPFSDPARVVPVPLDVTDQEAMAAAAKQATGVDLLISNAGVPCYGPVLGDQDEETFRAAVEVNLFGPLRLVRTFAGTRDRPGTGVIFVLSAAAVALSRSAPMYSASKAACLMLALAVREELRGTGAHVTIVLPGFMDTAMAAGFDLPKASPMQVAERSLDGWSAGQNTVWPDRFAEVVRDAVGEKYQRLLDDPRTTRSEMQAAFLDG
jgi:NAD(P)-dependent dehydrogenase (short-subunit alcohol dehydrogenase family)